MQVEIDFEVFKALTSLRQSEADSYNAVIRRLLGLRTDNALNDLLVSETPRAVLGEVNALAASPKNVVRKGLFGSGKHRNALMPDTQHENVLAKYFGGVWFNNIHFPEGARFRATYKGQTFLAEVKDGQWVGADGIARSSPSDAASAISHTNVNGWRFWFVQMPGDPAWRRMDELRA
jgi:predicted CopG family antitoxin